MHRLLGHINTLFQPFKNVFFKQKFRPKCAQMQIFWIKVVKIATALGLGSAPEPSMVSGS